MREWRKIYLRKESRWKAGLLGNSLRLAQERGGVRNLKGVARNALRRAIKEERDRAKRDRRVRRLVKDPDEISNS